MKSIVYSIDFRDNYKEINHVTSKSDKISQCENVIKIYSTELHCSFHWEYL